ncbi:MAG: hypothetical protein EBY16_02700 [Gammaproteobacteria bacterium]|nr:hypothetical protein [Gammaproteobacteria bacterium]
MPGFKYSRGCLFFCAVIHANLSFADFVNGGFEQVYGTTSPALTIPGWNSQGYIFSGYRAGLVLPPKSLNDILLTPTSSAPSGITDIVKATNTQTLYDYFLNGALPTTTIKLPVTGEQTAMVNVRTVNAIKSVSGTSSKPRGWSTYAKQATALSQTITISTADFNAGVVHIRFKVAPVMENPAHTAKQQPFYAIQINNLTTTRKGSNPLYFQWSYAAQPGVPWKTLSSGGSNSGSNATYTYTDWQTYDIPLDASVVSVGDQIELVVLAAGCSPGGHDGHVYLDDVTTASASAEGLTISVTGDSTTYAGGSICYTYSYQYVGSGTTGVTVTAHMPQSQNSSTPYDAIYDSNTDPSTGSVKSCTFDVAQNVLNCNIGDLPNGGQASGTFSMCVTVPGDWPTSYGPINNGNYPIQSSSINPVLGNLWQTTMGTNPNPPATHSNLVVDPSGLLIDGKNPSVNSGDLYPNTHYYTCSNAIPGATAAATNATCNIDNLPPNISVDSSCTISTGGAWTQPGTIPIGATVTCNVSGIADSEISREWDVVISSSAANNINNTQNTATVPFYIYNNPVDIPATLNGSSVLTPINICCGRPVMLFDLPIESDLVANYSVIATTGNIKCTIGSSGVNSFVKVFGRPGTCTIQGTKDGQISAPLTLIAQ